MKRFTLLLAFIGMISLQSCTHEDEVDYDTISEVFEYSGVDFVPADYTAFLDFPHSISASDMVLVYRLSGTAAGEDVWKLQPETYYFADGTLDYGYDFDFTRFDVKLSMIGNDLQTLPNSARLNQVFRVVIVPGYFGKMSNNRVNGTDLNDYNAVVKAFNIDESKIVRIN